MRGRRGTLLTGQVELFPRLNHLRSWVTPEVQNPALLTADHPRCRRLDDDMLEMSWIEHNEPPVSRPERPGHGHRMLVKCAEAQLWAVRAVRDPTANAGGL
jgi:hypothetical protein